MASEKIKNLGDQMVILTVQEVQQLAAYLKETYQIELPKLATSVAPANLPAVSVAKTSFDLILKAAGANKLQVMKTVKDITGFELKKSKELVDSAPSKLLEGVTEDVANRFATELRALGADVELK
jgi:large subunit ribosomal protein L7/L12